MRQDTPELPIDPPEMDEYWAWRSAQYEEPEYDKAEREIP